MRFAYPLRVEAARQWRAGRVPHWNPYSRVGSPLLADLQAGALYPGNVPFLFEREPGHYRALEQVAVLHSLLAAALMFLFLRTLDLQPLAAVLGGLAFAENGFMFWVTSVWTQFQGTMAWAPLVLAAIHQMAKPGGRWHWIALGALGVAFQVLAGQPELTIYTGLIAGGYALVLAWANARTGGRPYGALIACASIYGLGAGLAAIQIAPTLELVALSQRGITLSLREFQQLPIAFGTALGLAVPGIGIALPHPFPTIGRCYLGAIAAVFAIEGMRGLDHRRMFFTLVAVLGFLLALGPSTPLSELAHGVPVLNVFRYPYKHLFEVMFALSILAALGADSFLTNRAGSALTVGCAGVGILALVLWHVPISALPAISALDLTHPAWRTMLAAAGLAVTLALLPWRRPAVIAGLAGLTLGYYANRGDVLQHATWEAFERERPPAALLDLLGRDGRPLAPRYTLLLTGAETFTEYRNEYLAGDAGTLFRVPTIHGLAVFLWKPLAEALNMRDGVFLAPQQLLRKNAEQLRILAGRYVGVPTKSRTRTGSDLPVAWEGDGLTVLEQTDTLAPIRFVDEVRCADGAGPREQIRLAALEADRLALVDCRDVVPPPARLAPRQAARVEEIENAPGRLALRTQVDDLAPALLVVSQAHFPGWSAYLDGVPTPLYRTYGLVQAVVTPPGTHTVVLTYTTPGFRRGAALSVLAALVLGLLLLLRKRGQPASGDAS